MERNDVKIILDGLDVAHAEIAHSSWCFDLINPALPKLIGGDCEVLLDAL